MQSFFKTLIIIFILLISSRCSLFSNEVICESGFFNIDKDKEKIPDISFKENFAHTYSIIGVSYNGIENQDSLKVFEKIFFNLYVKLPYANYSANAKDLGKCFYVVDIDTSISFSFKSRYVLSTNTGIANSIKIKDKYFVAYDSAMVFRDYECSHLNLKNNTFYATFRDISESDLNSKKGFKIISIMNYIKIFSTDSNLFLKIERGLPPYIYTLSTQNNSVAIRMVELTYPISI